MVQALAALADTMVRRVLPSTAAGACVPPEYWYECYNHAQLYCYNNCAGEVFCSGTGNRC